MCVARSAALQPTALYISAAIYNTIWSQKNLLFLLHLCAFGKKLCSAVTCRLIHFHSCLQYNLVPKNPPFSFTLVCFWQKKKSLLHTAALQPTALYISAVVKWAAAPVALSRCTQPHIALSHFQCFVTVMKYYSGTTALFQFKCSHKGLLCHY